MIKEAMQYIIEQAKTENFNYDGIEYTSRSIYPVRPPKAKDPLILNTLTGLVDFIHNSNNDQFHDPIIHIVNQTTVNLISGLDPKFKDREIYAKSVYNPPNFAPGHYYPSDEFIVLLQSAFIATDDLKNLLKVVGNVREEMIKQTQDDGITQTVTVKSGVVRVADVEIPNPITLVPRWTFPEVDQPVVPFVVRAQDGPQWALFTADGGAWKNQTILNIKEWLRDIVKDIPIIA